MVAKYAETKKALKLLQSTLVGSMSGDEIEQI
jgi:hypothetical protein